MKLLDEQTSIKNKLDDAEALWLEAQEALENAKAEYDVNA
jgi:F0F1-type ATP synthase membrane subunit b/b'